MEALSVCAELDVDALTALLDDTAALISSYVVQDPRKELSPEAVQEGQDAVRGWLVGRCAALERWDGLRAQGEMPPAARAPTRPEAPPGTAGGTHRRDR